MVRSNFNFTDAEQIVIDSALSVAKLVNRKPFFKRMSLRTHRIKSIYRYAMYKQAAVTIRMNARGSKALHLLANEVEKSIGRKQN